MLQLSQQLYHLLHVILDIKYIGFERYGIDANRNGFSRVSFVVEKKRRKFLIV